ncbi:MAG: chorismate mutase [Lachnospiraceae bacterium]|nr:chorismate mutase [Lachnospiraceae bacterium]
MKSLTEAREKIDEIDKQMAELFVKRMQCSKDVAEYKKENGIPILDSGREKIVLDKNEEYINDFEIKPYYRQLMQDIMDISKQYQHSILERSRIAYSGIEGAFAHIAALKLFPDAEHISCRNFKSAYNSVENGKCDVAVLPIENSNAGEVGAVMDLMYEGNLFINGIYPLRISQNLLGVEGSSIQSIKKVISHSQAIEQCTEYIERHNIEVIQSTNTAVAAKQVAMLNDISIAAIASKETAELYNLKLLDHDINEDLNNTTRFAVLSRKREDIINSSEGNTVILMFSVKNEAGMLAKAIGVIGKHGFSMNSLRSRPLKSLSWQYYFYTEIAGLHGSSGINDMIKEMSLYCEALKILGASKDNKIL